MVNSGLSSMVTPWLHLSFPVLSKWNSYPKKGDTSLLVVPMAVSWIFPMHSIILITVQPWVRTCLDSKFGPHTIDRFASRNNVQVSPPRYNSLYFEAAAEWLDAFSCHWTWAPDLTYENNWIHPPYKLLGQVLSTLPALSSTGYYHSTSLGAGSLVACGLDTSSILFRPGSGTSSCSSMLPSRLGLWPFQPSTCPPPCLTLSQVFLTSPQCGGLGC